MLFERKSGAFIVACLGGLLGAIFFLIVFGHKILNPTYTDWIFALGSDHILTAIGWQFFRFEPWHFPLGNILNYGILGSSIVSTGLIPLMAIPLKLVNHLLPAHFQYIGWWFLSCYILQGFFSVILLRRITSNVFFCLIGSVFFIASIIMLFRAANGHYILAAHWLFLYALWLNIKDPDAKHFLHWFIAICASALIFPYMYVMVFGLFFADILRNCFTIKYFKKKEVGVYSAGILFFSIFLLWIVGTFQMGVDGFEAGGFGLFSMNLNAIINPMGNSRLLKDFASATGGQYEGLNYLGFGILLLLFFTLINFPSEPLLIKEKFKKYWSLLLVLVLFAGYAVSNVVTFDKYTLFHVGLAKPLEFIAYTFRASGRFFFPVYYAIFFAVLWATHYFITSKYKTKFVVLSIILFVQIFDFSEAFVHYRKMYAETTYSWSTKLKSSFWEQQAKAYRKIIFVPNIVPADYYEFALLAANNGMSVSSGYMARVNNAKMDVASNKILADFKSGNLDEKALYIIEDNNLLQSISPALRSRYCINKIDGYDVVVSSAGTQGCNVSI